MLYAIKRAKYRKFCKNYHPQPKPEKRNYWGSRLLAGVMLKGKPKKSPSPGQMSLPWDNSRVSERPEVHEVAEKFIQANGFNPRSDKNTAVPGIGSLKR